VTQTVQRPKASSNGRAPEVPDDAERDLALLPVDSLREARPFLRRPFTVKAVKWKVQTANAEAGWAMCVPHIDARLVSERLNLVCPHLWQHRFRDENGRTWCDLTVDGLTRPDMGDTWQGKGLVSDAFKRAAVHFGVGVSLYAIPKMFLRASDGHVAPARSNRGPTLRLIDAGEQRLRQLYEQWLEDYGIQRFGRPLDHGDDQDSVGDPDVPAQAAAVEQQQAADQPVSAVEEDPERALVAYLAIDSPLAAKRRQANDGMLLLSAGPARRLRELRDAGIDERALDALLDRVNAAADGATP